MAEKLKDSIDVVTDNDSEMPQQETKDYNPTMLLTDKFMTLFEGCLGKMPYATMLTNGKGQPIKIIDLYNFVMEKKECINREELSMVIGFVGNAEFRYVKNLMSIIENPEQHYLLWQETDAK